MFLRPFSAGAIFISCCMIYLQDIGLCYYYYYYYYLPLCCILFVGMIPLTFVLDAVIVQTAASSHIHDLMSGHLHG
jgi:hypothetical protein